MKNYIVLLLLTCVTTAYSGGRFDNVVTWIRDTADNHLANKQQPQTTIRVTNDSRDFFELETDSNSNRYSQYFKNLLDGTELYVNDERVELDQTCSISVKNNTITITIITPKRLYQHAYLDNIELTGIMKWLSKYLRAYVVFHYTIDPDVEEITISEAVIDKIERWQDNAPKLKLSCNLLRAKVEFIVAT